MVDKADQFRKQGGIKIAKKKTSTGWWDFEVEWVNGSPSWIPLKYLKESNPTDIAKYAIANHIVNTEPAFDWWLHEHIKRQNRMIKPTKKHLLEPGYKFGVRLPNTIPEALELDRINRNTLWYDTIIKKMQNVCIDFDIQGRSNKPPSGYKWIPLHISHL